MRSNIVLVRYGIIRALIVQVQQGEDKKEMKPRI